MERENEGSKEGRRKEIKNPEERGKWGVGRKGMEKVEIEKRDGKGGKKEKEGKKEGNKEPRGKRERRSGEKGWERRKEGKKEGNKEPRGKREMINE